jgi:hypothetical protein
LLGRHGINEASGCFTGTSDVYAGPEASVAQQAEFVAMSLIDKPCDARGSTLVRKVWVILVRQMNQTGGLRVFEGGR